MLLKYLPFKLILLYFVISQFTNQFYPFSKFPMYSSFPTSTERYYITNKNNELIPSFLEFNVHTAELKQRIINKQNQGDINVHQAVLNDITDINNSTKYSEIILWKENIEMVNYSLKKETKLVTKIIAK